MATTRIYLVKYKNENRMSELTEIKNKLFTFNQNDIAAGLSIAKQIYGLGVAGASGLLAILYPNKFATVDQFIVKALCSIEDFNEASEIFNMKPENLSINDGVILVDIMKNKAKKLNSINKTDFWTPRKIDKVLWAYGR